MPMQSGKILFPWIINETPCWVRIDLFFEEKNPNLYEAEFTILNKRTREPDPDLYLSLSPEAEDLLLKEIYFRMTETEAELWG